MFLWRDKVFSASVYLKWLNWRWYWSRDCSLFQLSIEMPWLWLHWGVHQCLALCYCQDMVFSSTFSHFSQFLAKMADFGGWFWSRDCSLFQFSLQMSQLWLEWGVHRLLEMCRCQDIALSSIFSLFSQCLAKMADFEGDSKVESVPFFNLH